MQAQLAFGRILVLLLLVAFVVLLVGVVISIVVLLIRRGRGTTDGGTCGGCGYMVRGLSTLRCPECGADLREVGINKPAKRSSKALTILIILLGVLLFLSCTCTGMMFWGIRGTAVSTPVPAPLPAPRVTLSAPG